MFIAKDTFEIMKPFVTVARIFGLCPITYEIKGNHFVIKRSATFIMYSYFLAAVLVFFTFLGITNDLTVDENHSIRMKLKKTRYITCCDISIVIILVLFSIITTPFKLKTFWKMMQCFNMLDNWIPLDDVQKYKNQSRNFILGILFGFTLIVTFDGCIWDTFSRKNNIAGQFWKNYFTFYLLYYIVMMQEIFFAHTVYYVRIRLALLNKTLAWEATYMERLKNKFVTGRSFVATINPSNAKNGDKNPSSSSNKRNITMNNADRIVMYSQAYEKICEAVDYVNDNGGLVIIIILLSCLVHLIVTPYFLLFEISNNGNKWFISLQTTWLITHASRLLLVVEPCHQCLMESMKTLNLVCDVLTYTKDEDAKKTLSVFAMQLSYCKIKFYSCGLVKIDRSLITAVVGAVTTYLVILFQFNKV